eukprot:01797_5
MTLTAVMMSTQATRMTFLSPIKLQSACRIIFCFYCLVLGLNLESKQNENKRIKQKHLCLFIYRKQNKKRNTLV